MSELLRLLKPLMDPEYCMPFPSAWELNPFEGARTDDGEMLDGEELHARIKAVYQRLTGTA